MEARDHGVLIFPNKKVCGLEWIVWAMDAARQYNDTKQQEVPCDISIYYYSDQLTVL
jgi:hypothetical protein